MFKKVLGFLVVLSMVIGGVTVLQSMGGQSAKGEGQVKEITQKEQEKNESKIVSKQKALEKRLAEIRENLRERYKREGLSGEELEKQVELHLKLIKKRVNLNAATKSIKKIKEGMKTNALWLEDAILDLGRTMDPEGVPFLIDILKNYEKSDSVRACAASALAITGDKSSIPALKESLRDKSPKVQISSARTLAYLGEKELSFTVLVKAKAFEVFVETNDKRAIPFIKEALEDENAYVRVRASYSLIRLGEEKSIVFPVLIEALNDRDRYLRSCALGALAKIGDEKSIFLIKGVLNHKDRSTRESALEHLERLAKVGNREAIVALKESLDNEDRIIRSRAKEALKRIEKDGLKEDKKSE
ncbi:MAG: HEAT repeat domain-containing protein [bacterium]